MLQVRVGKRSPSAAFRIAVDLVDEGRIDLDEALRRVDGTKLQLTLHPQFAATDGAEVVGRGLAANPGAAVGEVVLDAATATAWAGTGREVILVRPETSADDVAGMIAAAAVVTARGLLRHADRRRTLGVRANAETGPEASLARIYGADGIGLCRTEHMLLGSRRVLVENLVTDVDR